MRGSRQLFAKALRMSITDYLDIAPDVSAALAPVALETTVIAHGLPYPQNLEVAQRLEAAVRAAGAPD